MPITRSTLTASGTTTDAASFATASVAPTANEVVMLAISNTITSGVTAPTSVTGNGITYTKAVEKVIGTRAVSIWWGVSASPSAGAITIDFGANIQTTCAWDVEQTTGASNATPIAQSQTGSGTAAIGSLTAPLSAFSDITNNLGFYIAQHGANEATNPATSWTEIQDMALGTPAAAHETAFISGGSALNPQPTWTTSAAYAMAAVEIAVPVAGGPSTTVISMVV